MLICAAGDIHGAMDRLYQDVLVFEASLGICFDYVLHVGDFGVWPDPSRVDKATRRHDGAGDFPVWLGENRRAPRPTVFIKGNHEDFVWLDSRPAAEVLPGLSYLRNGCTVDIRDEDAGVIRVGAVGGCYGPSDYQRRSDQLQAYAKRHYTLDEIERLANSCGVDIMLTHDAPAGVRFERHRRGTGYVSDAAGLDVLLIVSADQLACAGQVTHVAVRRQLEHLSQRVQYPPRRPSTYLIAPPEHLARGAPPVAARWAWADHLPHISS
jgi:Calcineurin-like phosphoesterase